MRPGAACAKYILFAFNLVFVIFGILLVVFGAKSVYGEEAKHLQDVVKEYPSNSAIALILIGIAIFVIAFLGCCGAIKENSCMLNSFSGIVFLLLVVEVIALGLILAFKPEFNKYAEDGMKDLMSKYNWTSPSADRATQVVDDIQSSLHCCGAANNADWNMDRPSNISTDKFPHSCCDGVKKGEYCEKEKIYQDGCVDRLVEAIHNSIYPLSAIGITVAVAQLLGVLMACCLAREIRREYQIV